MSDDLFWEKVAGKWSVIMEQKEDKVVPPLSSVLEDDWPLDVLDAELKALLDEIEP